MPHDITLRTLSHADARACSEQLADVLIDCVEGGASVSFMLPLSRTTALDYWHDIAGGVERGERTLIVAQDKACILGTVQLITAMPDNQQHRADVAKLLVRRRARGAGIGGRLMEAVEEAARAQGRSVLVLDTADSTAERLYARSGWQRVGSVPDFACLPNGPLCATTFFYKHCGPASAIGR